MQEKKHKNQFLFAVFSENALIFKGIRNGFGILFQNNIRINENERKKARKIKKPTQKTESSKGPSKKGEFLASNQNFN